MTNDQLTPFIGKYCRFSWLNEYGRPESMAGWLWKIEEDAPNEHWAVVDWGMAVRVADLNDVQEVKPPRNQLDFNPESGLVLFRGRGGTERWS